MGVSLDRKERHGGQLLGSRVREGKTLVGDSSRSEFWLVRRVAMRGSKKGEKGEAGGLMPLRAGAAATVARVVWEGLVVGCCERERVRAEVRAATSNTKTGRSSPADTAGESWRWKGGLLKVNSPQYIHSLDTEQYTAAVLYVCTFTVSTTLYPAHTSACHCYVAIS